MKRVLKFTGALALLFASTSLLANGPVKTFGKKGFGVEKELIDIDLDPVFLKKGDKLLLNLLNLDQDNVIVKIYDSEGRILFKETFEGKLVVEKAFNFEKAFEDEYTIVVIDSNKTYKEKVTVK
ncbi:MAG: hypothetical protein CMH48_02920 [Muricauda sp.]|nr:hypothetical protein [Allomuricauda sp.]MAU26022.1 hypothetical protein [Allomuricauda sp.]MBC29773.1 hypothetical protein [Allomuricauda sp.]|tara:strand:- start:54392 stop:54763 length:372 start_codon:yes stop_codon:yes gene_type:complete